MEKIIFVAVSENGVIGIKGDLPWHIPVDLKRFKQYTLGYPVIMGRNTFESIVKRIAKPLPGRKNIVLSSRKDLGFSDVHVFDSFDSAMKEAQKEGKEKVFIIGGGKVYSEAFNRDLIDTIYLTRIHGTFEGDSSFPILDKSKWYEEKIGEGAEGELKYTFFVYRRRKLPDKVAMIKEKLDEFDPEIAFFIKKETERQKKTINLIPSENYASVEVMEACANPLMNKYAEGYPLKRYYQGNKYVDEIEILAINRAKELFGAEHVNVQPYSGSPANLAVFLAFLKPGDKFMGLDLACGGHLTHGSHVNFSGNIYVPVPYSLDKDSELLDMNKVREIALRDKPKLIISGLTAYPRQIDFSAFQKIAEEVGAVHLADISHIAGLIASGVHPSPFPFTDVVTTTTHKTLRGPRGAIIMCKEKYAKQIDKAVFPGCQGGPHMNSIAGKAVAFKEALSPEFKVYGNQIVKNAKVLSDTLIKEGIKIVTNGTDNHLILIDLRNFGVGLGKQIASALEEAGIVLNANAVPFDPSPPLKPSGIRLGTPMVTTRGMREPEMIQLGKWITAVIKDYNNLELKEKTKLEVEQLCLKFPIYSEL